MRGRRARRRPRRRARERDPHGTAWAGVLHRQPDQLRRDGAGASAISRSAAKRTASSGSRREVVTRMARELAMRNRSPASTPQPRSCSAATVASSCATGIQTFSPELPWESMPRSRSVVDERLAPQRVRRCDGSGAGRAVRVASRVRRRCAGGGGTPTRRRSDVGPRRAPPWSDRRRGRRGEGPDRATSTPSGDAPTVPGPAHRACGTAVL